MLLVVGLVLGAALAIAMASGASSLLFGLSPRDPMTGLIPACRSEEQGDRCTENGADRDSRGEETDIVPIGDHLARQAVVGWLRDRSRRWYPGNGRYRPGRAGGIEHKTLAQGW